MQLYQGWTGVGCKHGPPASCASALLRTHLDGDKGDLADAGPDAQVGGAGPVPAQTGARGANLEGLPGQSRL